MKTLLIEDEADLLESMKTYFMEEGILCETASDYNQASELISVYKYDCIIVDINLPSGSGLDLVKEIKNQKSDAGIIIISARNALDDKIHGLESGSDDYLTKPFHLSELNARVKALVRRRNYNGSQIFKHNELKVDFSANNVTVHGKEITLTFKEYELLLYFISNKNKVISKEAIAERLWGSGIDQADSFDFIYTHIKNLRKKISDADGSDWLKTVYGLGYKFKIE